MLAHSIAKLAFDEQTLTLRIDLFNLTNRTNFGVPNRLLEPGASVSSRSPVLVLSVLHDPRQPRSNLRSYSPAYI